MKSRPGGEKQFEIGDAAGVLDAVMSHSGACMKILDLDGRVIRWSPACEKLYGWSPQEAEGKVLPHVPDEKRVEAIAFLRSVAETGEIRERADIAVNAEGWRSNIRIIAVPVADEDGHAAGVLTIAREALTDERSDSLHDRFSMFVGRTLSEPLGAITNAALLLARPEVGGDPERRARLVQNIVTLARETGDLVDDLRVSTAGSGEGLVLDRQRVDVGSLLAEVAGAMGRDSQRLLVDFDPGAAFAEVDKTRVARAFALVFRNAVASAVPGSTVCASARRSGPEILIEVVFRSQRADEGAYAAALDPAYPLEGVDGSRRQSLTRHRYVRAVAEAHGGHMTVSVDDGDGVTVRFSVRDDRATSTVRREA